MAESLRKLSRWALEWVGALIAIGIALALGAVFGMAADPEVWGQVAGAALGAAFAVLGAFGLNELRAAAARRSLREAVAAAVDAIDGEAVALSGLRRNHQTVDVQYMFGRSHAQALVGRWEYLERFGPCLDLGDQALLRALADVRAFSRRVGDILQVIQNEPPAATPGQVTIPYLQDQTVKDNRVKALESAGEQLHGACQVVTDRMGSS